MTIDRRLLAGALGLSLVLAACGGSSTASPAASTAAGASAAPTAAPTAAATDGAATAEPTEGPTTEAPTGSPGTEPSFVAGAAADLEALLPSEAGGVTFVKSSFDGSSIGGAALGIDTGSLKPILDKNGKSINDVRVAIATSADTTGANAAMVLALQIKGVPAEQLLGATGTDIASLTKTTIAGKQVYSAGAAGFSVIIYPKDDVVFEVLLASDKVAEAIVAKLP